MYGLCIINEFAACTGPRNLNFQKSLQQVPLGPEILILKNLKKSQKMLIGPSDFCSVLCLKLEVNKASKMAQSAVLVKLPFSPKTGYSPCTKCAQNVQIQISRKRLAQFS